MKIADTYMNRMRHWISIAVLMTWMAGAFQVLGATCLDHPCCTDSRATFKKVTLACGMASCLTVSEQDTQETFLLSKSFQIEPAVFLILEVSYEEINFSSDFNLLLSNVDPPGSFIPVYLRHQQFLI